jgi:hypothetical protein
MNGCRVGFWSLAVAAVACVPTGEEEPISCSKAAWTGSYRLSYAALASSCGPIADEVGRLEAGDVVPPAGSACTYGRATWSDDECNQETRWTCTTAQGTLEWSADLEQLSEDGSQLSGIATVRSLDAAGNELCTGRYHLNAARQA